jgi:type IV pilus assembly protein PilW
MTKSSSKLLKMNATQMNKQQGFTLVELMVSLALSLIVIGAAVSALLVSRQGFTSVDVASQLRDNARFATDFITRLSVQSGFKDALFVDTAAEKQFKAVGVAADPDPPVFGFNNAVIGTATDPLNTTNESRDTKCPTTDGTACANGSDILVLRYQVGAKNTESLLGGVEVDNAMFNCAGTPQSRTAGTSDDVIESILYVSMNAGTKEPSLMCKYKESTGATWANTPTPLVEGVESFQVLYGTDAVVPGTVPVARAAPGAAPTAAQPDTIPERYLRADQLTVVGNDSATKENWRRVRSLRIGLIIRGPAGSAQDRGTTLPLTPLGPAFADGADKQSSFVQIPLSGVATTGDGRLRQVVTFTVYLHNQESI